MHSNIFFSIAHGIIANYKKVGWYGYAESTKQMEEKLNFQVPAEGLELKIKISCTGVHGFEEKSKFHVPGYLDLKKKQNIMYPGTWI